ncbi:hypothetical protein Tco_1342317, partial [Tanacetum coccineum]
MFQQGEDLVECINKAMTFMSIVALRFPPSNNQLRTSSNPRNQATFKMVESQFNKFKEDKIRVMLALETEELLLLQREIMQLVNQELCSVITIKEKGIWLGRVLSQKSQGMLHDCDDLSSAKAILMENLSSCDPEVLSDVVQIVLWY